MATLLFIAALLLLPALYVRDSRVARRQRGNYFAGCLELFDSYRVVRQGQGFPLLTGRYRGADVRLELVMDDMAWRKLPCLWLKVTVLAPNPQRGMLGLLVRARGTEFYSPTAEMKEGLALPASFPSDAILRSDDAATAPVTAVQNRIEIFSDARMKELVVTPLGVRLVYQLAQAERAEYLVLRQANFSAQQVDTALARQLLDSVLAIAASVDRAEMLREPVAA